MVAQTYRQKKTFSRKYFLKIPASVITVLSCYTVFFSTATVNGKVRQWRSSQQEVMKSAVIIHRRHQQSHKVYFQYMSGFSSAL